MGDVPADLWVRDSLLLWWNCWKCFQRSLGTLAQPRGRPRSPESATQLTRVRETAVLDNRYDGGRRGGRGGRKQLCGCVRCVKRCNGEC
jgi:hypothetical protein